MSPAVFCLRLRAVILTVVVAWACAGGVLWQVARIVHYHAVRIGSAEATAADTVRVSPASKVVWIEDDELRLDGRMFDVRSRKKVGADWLLAGHYDAADDEIFSLLHALFGLGSQPGERGGRICIFLPEAVLFSTVSVAPLRACRPQPLYNPSPEEHWLDACLAGQDIPPETTA